jgi:hypothetical protein
MRLALAAAFVFIALPATTNAQSPRMDALSLDAGARAGIVAPTAASKYGINTVASARPDGLSYALNPRLATKSLAWQRISTMDASTAGHRHVARDAGIGFLVGLVGGAALGATTSGCCNKEGRELRAVAIVANGLLGGAIGAAAGAIVGYAWRSEN